MGFFAFKCLGCFHFRGFTVQGSQLIGLAVFMFAVYFPSQFACQLPSLNIFKPFNIHPS